MTDPWNQTVPCQDFAGRTSTLAAFINGEHRVGFTTPAPGTATFNLLELQQLQRVLADMTLAAAARSGENLGQYVPRSFQETHEVLDAHLKFRKVGIAAVSGAVVYSGNVGYWQVQPAEAERIADDLRAAAAVAREQKRRQQ